MTDETPIPNANANANPMPLPNPDGDRDDRNRRYFGVDALAQLATARVLVVGAGAVGNEICKHLGMIGVGEILLVDPDLVTDSNLNRCVFFRPGQGAAKLPKTEAIARAFAEHGFATTIDSRPVPIEAVPIEDWADIDLAICGVDDDHARYFLNTHLLAAAHETGQSRFLIEGAMGADFTQFRALELPLTACLVCGWTADYVADMMARRKAQTCLEFFIDTRAIFPAISTQTSLVSAQMATEAIKILAGLPTYRATGEWPATRDGRMIPRLGRFIRSETPAHTTTIASILRNRECVEPFCRDAAKLFGQ